MSSQTKQKPPVVAVISAAAAVILGTSLTWFESGKKEYLKPYYDGAGVLTVCDGLTGKWIDKNKTYTTEECKVRKQNVIAQMSAEMARCGIGPMTDSQWIVWGHFSYNVGTTALCNSTAGRLLREKKHVQACGQIPRWTWSNDARTGKKVNCRTAGRVCPGIVTRRDYEYKICMAAAREALQ